MNGEQPKFQNNPGAFGQNQPGMSPHDQQTWSTLRIIAGSLLLLIGLVQAATLLYSISTYMSFSGRMAEYFILTHVSIVMMIFGIAGGIGFLTKSVWGWNLTQISSLYYLLSAIEMVILGAVLYGGYGGFGSLGLGIGGGFGIGILISLMLFMLHLAVVIIFNLPGGRAHFDVGGNQFGLAIGAAIFFLIDLNVVMFLIAPNMF